MPKTFFILFLSLTAITSYASDLYPPEKDMSKPQRALFRSAPIKKFDSNKGLEKLTGLPTGAGNAAENYAKLEKLFAQDQIEQGVYKVKKRSKGINEILKAVSKKKCQFAPKYYPYMNKGTVQQPDILIFLTYLNGLLNLAEELEDKGDLKGADAVYRSALIFGWHLTQQPPTLITERLGVTIKRIAAEQYSGFLLRKMDMKKSDQALAYKEYLSEINIIFNRTLNYYLGAVINFNSLFSTIKIATQAEEITWRQQAILILGLYRYGIVNIDGEIIDKDPKMQKYAEDALTSITENGKTQSEKQLAAWVTQKLTPEIFIEINSKSEISGKEFSQ